MTNAQDTPDPRIADLAQAGKIRVALYPPQYAKDPATEELRGWTIQLGRALAARVGIEFSPVEYSTPPQALNALKAGACDVGFGAMDASRNSEIDFSPPVLQFDFTYLVPADSLIAASPMRTVQGFVSRWCATTHRPCV